MHFWTRVISAKLARTLALMRRQVPSTFDRIDTGTKTQVMFYFLCTARLRPVPCSARVIEGIRTVAADPQMWGFVSKAAWKNPLFEGVV